MFGILVWSFPIAYDPYGDAVIFEKHLNQIAIVDDKVFKILFGFSLDAWSGQKTIQALVSVISHYFDLTISEAFGVIDLISGIVFAFFWIYFLTTQFKNLLWVIILSVIGLSAPFALNFFGRHEIYSPSLALLMIWSVLIIKYLHARKLKWLILLVILNLLSVKAHPIAVLLLPSTLFAAGSHFSYLNYSKLTWSNGIKYVLVPLILCWSFLYFLVLQDHLDDRSLQQTAMQYDHLFLPLFSPTPPLQNYNLLSLNHIRDFLNVVSLWSPAAIFILVIAFLTGKLKPEVSKPEFVLIAAPLILISGLLFVVNPILSMPMDWDLFSIPAPLTLVLSVFALRSIGSSSVQKILPFALATAILGSSFITIHTAKTPIANRLESVAIHVHKTYYEWTVNILVRSDSIMGTSQDATFENRQRVINILRPNAQPGVDREISELIRDQAKYLYREKKQFAEAGKMMREAVIYDPQSGNNQMTLMELRFLEGDKRQAYQHSLRLIELNHPSEEQALKIATHCALEAKMYDKALQHVAKYRESWENQVMDEVYFRLSSESQIETLKLLFRSGDNSS